MSAAVTAVTGVADGIQMSGRSNKIISSPAVTRHPGHRGQCGAAVLLVE